MLIPYIITFILGAILFVYTLFKWISEQSSSLIFYIILFGCLLSLGGIRYFPYNLIILFILFVLPVVINNLNNRAIKAMRQQDYNTCNRLIKRDPTNAAAFAKLGHLLEYDKKYREAIDAYEKSLAADDKQRDVERRYQALVEKFALEESNQIHCPKCQTIVPVEYGKCWKCETLFDRRQYLLSIIKKKGTIGIVTLIVCGLSFLISIFALIAVVIQISPAVTLLNIFLTITAVSGITAYLIYKKQ